MKTPIELQIRHLPPSVRRRCEKALGIAKPESEHKVFVYGTLLTGECNAHRAGCARRQKAWALGTIYDTGWRFPAFTKNGRTRVAGEVLTVDDDGFRSMDALEGYPRLYRREQIRVHLVGGGCSVRGNIPDADRLAGRELPQHRALDPRPVTHVSLIRHVLRGVAPSGEDHL